MIINVKTMVSIPLDKAWELWTVPEHIIKWNYASDDWQTTRAQNDLRNGGKFSYRMEAKDGSFGFDFSGVHKEVELFKFIDSLLDDGRMLQVSFESRDGKTLINEDFEGEIENSVDLQRKGWQAILDNFKKYAEGLEK